MIDPALILASASPRRRDLLQQIGIVPALCLAADLDETPAKGEVPRAHALRLALEKAHTIFAHQDVRQMKAPFLVLAADTVVAVGRRILPKAETEAEARACLKLLSGRAHRVYTALVVIAQDGTKRTRVVETRVSVKHLAQDEIETYIASMEWQGKAGGYAIQGYAARFVSALSGSYSGVVGLPLYETAHLLKAAGLAGDRTSSQSEGRVRA